MQNDKEKYDVRENMRKWEPIFWLRIPERGGTEKMEKRVLSKKQLEKKKNPPNWGQKFSAEKGAVIAEKMSEKSL